MEHSRTRPPPGVEEALSSMLWTPYPADSDDSSSDDSEAPARKKRPLTWHPGGCGGAAGGTNLPPPFTIYAPAFLPAYNLPPYTPKPANGMVHSYTDTFLQHNQDRMYRNQHESVLQSPFVQQQYHDHQEPKQNTTTTTTSKKHVEKQQQHQQHQHSHDDREQPFESLKKPVTVHTKQYVGVSKPPQYDSTTVYVHGVHSDRTCVGGGGDGGEVRDSFSQMVEVLNESVSSCVRVSDKTRGAQAESCSNSNSSTVVRMRFSVPGTDEGEEGKQNNPNCLTIEVNQEEKSEIDENGVKIINNNAVPVQIVHNNNNRSGNLNSSCNSSNVNIKCSGSNSSHNEDNSFSNCDLIKDNNLSNRNSDGTDCNAAYSKFRSANNSNKEINVSIIENINSNSGSASDHNTSAKIADQRIYITTENPVAVHNSHKSEVLVVPSETMAAMDREQRRRERRERRAARNRMSHIHTHIQPPSHPPPPPPPAPVAAAVEILPDLLNSHLPPPYTTLPSQAAAAQAAAATVITPIPVAAVDSCRYSFPLPIMRRSPSERSGKGCCGQWFAGPSLRALIAVVALGGLACALGGTALGVTSLAGPPQSHFTAALLMIGVGVILVTISGAAWKLTAPGGPPCLGLGTSADLGRCNRRACTRGGNPGHVIYPEFEHRPPPPSYQASMQEYRLRLLLLDRGRQPSLLRAVSPPPTYRSNTPNNARAPTRGNNSNVMAAAANTPTATTTTTTTTTVHNSPAELSNSDAIERISTNSSEATLPPSYRTRNKQQQHHHRYSRSHLLPSTSSSAVSPRLVYSSGGGAGDRRRELRRGASLERLTPTLHTTTAIVNNVNVHTANQPSKQMQQLQQPKKKELVTIVTISGAVEDDARTEEDDAGKDCAGTDEILAHL